MLVLRDYQQRAIATAHHLFAGGARAVLLCSPTGSGKGTIAAAMLGACAAKGRHGFFTVHRQEIVADVAQRLRASGLSSVGVLSGTRDRGDASALIQVCTVQTLHRRGTRPPADLIVWDECRHAVCDSYQAVREAYPEAYHVGLDATPCRADGTALSGVFDVLIEVATVAELTALGYLVPCTVLRPAMKLRGIAATPLEAYRKHSPNGHAIVFCGTLEHARHVAEDFRAAGVSAQAVEGETPWRERDAAVEAFRSGSLRVLTNVRLFTEGTDLPIASVAILAHGFAHDGSYLQAIGRVLRTHPGKTRALVLDLVGSALEFGLPSDPRVYSLEGRPIRVAEGLEPLRQCPRCGGVWRASLYVRSTCPRCGYRAPAKKDPAVRRAELQEQRAGHSQEERQAAYWGLVAAGRSRGYKAQWARIMYKSKYGSWPSVAWIEPKKEATA